MEYENQPLDDSKALMETSQQETDLAKDANQQSENYVLLTVMFASVLFFAGISSKFTAKWLQYCFLSFGAVIFIVGVNDSYNGRYIETPKRSSRGQTPGVTAA